MKDLKIITRIESDHLPLTLTLEKGDSEENNTREENKESEETKLVWMEEKKRRV